MTSWRLKSLAVLGVFVHQLIQANNKETPKPTLQALCDGNPPVICSDVIVVLLFPTGPNEQDSNERIDAILPRPILDNGPDHGLDIDIEYWPVQHHMAPALASVERRFYFPETWLWDTHVVG